MATKITLETVETDPDFPDLPVTEGEPGEDVRAVYVVDHPGMDGKAVAGCLFLAASRTLDEHGPPKQLTGYFWSPSATLTSKPARLPAFLAPMLKRVAGYRGTLALSDCAGLPESKDSCYARVLA